MISESLEQTEAAGAGLAGRLDVGDVVLVSGELGSGKTTVNVTIMTIPIPDYPR